MTANRCIFTEGSIVLPVNGQEQTLNVVHTEGWHNINISRDLLPAGKVLADYVSDQTAQLRANLSSLEMISQQSVSVGISRLPGVALTCRFVTGQNIPLWQYLVIVQITEQKVVLFSAVYPQEELLEKERDHFNAVLNSLQPAD